MSAWIVGSEEGFRHSLSAPVVGEPSFQDGGQVNILPVDGQGLAVDQDQDDRLAGGLQLLQQLALASREFEAGARQALAHAMAVFAHHGDDHIHIGGCFDGLIHLGAFLYRQGLGDDFALGPVGIRHFAAFTEDDFGIGADKIADALQHRRAIQAVGTVAADHVTVGVSQGTCHEDLVQFGLVQRQQPAFILEQDQGLAGHVQDEILLPGRTGLLVSLDTVTGVRVVEEAQAEFDREDFPHPLVDRLHRNLAGPDRLPKRFGISLRLPEIGAYVQARLQDGLGGSAHV